MADHNYTAVDFALEPGANFNYPPIQITDVDHEYLGDRIVLMIDWMNIENWDVSFRIRAELNI